MGQPKTSRERVRIDLGREWEGKRQPWMLWMKNEWSIGRPRCLDKCKASSGNTFAAAALLLGLPLNAPSPRLNIASTIQYDGSTWALFHFIHFSSIVIFIYYILLCLSRFLSLYIACPFLPVWASSTSAGRHFASTHNGACCCSDSVSLCKWNGIKWNVQFIVFRGFRIAMRHAQNKTKIAFPLPASV